MRTPALVSALLTSALFACGGSDGGATSNGAGGAGTTTSASTTAPSSSASNPSASTGSACGSGETACGTACIVGSDCDHAVTVAGGSHVYVNGGTFASLDVKSPGDVTAVHVADAAVASRKTDATHLVIEIPPGVAGNADITLDTGKGSVVTKRALDYYAFDEGTSWTKKTMSSGRGGDPAMATTFDDRAFVGAGFTQPDQADCTDTADLYDKATDSMIAAANAMTTKRWSATATTVLDGSTIIAGACAQLVDDACPYAASAGVVDRFDPKSNTFTTANATLSIPRSFLRNLRLADGRVLLISAEAPSIDLLDPAADAVTPSASGASNGVVARLRDGKVLIVPGAGAPNQIFDPASDTVTPTGDSLAELPDALVSLGDGRVFAIGGSTFSGSMSTTVDTIAVFDPATKMFTPWGFHLATSRAASTVVLARDGRIWVIGGLTGTAGTGAACNTNTGTTDLASVEIVNPDAKTTADNPVVAGPSLPDATSQLRSTILFDGSIVVAGGTPCGVGAVSYPWLYFLEAPPDPLQ